MHLHLHLLFFLLTTVFRPACLLLLRLFVVRAGCHSLDSAFLRSFSTSQSFPPSFNMRLSTFLLGAAIAARSAFAHPLDLPFELDGDVFDELDKRQSGGVVTTGVPGATHPRLEIRQLQSSNPNQWTLFLLAMQQFHAQAQTSATSYYQISGIHGVPRQNWNGIGQCSTCSGADGYCTHDSVLFPSWHRAYLALFEQQLVATAVSIANAWPTSGSSITRAQMQTAASTLRLPYWDWAAIPANGGPDLPPSTTGAQLTINAQTGQRTINNPLFRHDFTDASGMVYSPFINWKKTLRYPSSTASTATSNNNNAINAFNNIRASLQDQVYQLFTTCNDYAHFSNDDAGTSTTQCSNSLEGIHNTIHTTSGGGPSSSVQSGGHMYYLATAAFDPLFWLHHCNTDRLFALWQTLHPAKYGASQVAPHNTWTIAQGTTQNKNSPLTPFTKDSSGNFWTTAQVQNWATTFHYTYPEYSNSDGSKAAITDAVNRLYGPSASQTSAKFKRAENATLTNTTLTNDTTPLVANNGSLYQYVANIQTPRYHLNGSYYVFLFLGQPASEDPSSWIYDSNLVGPMGVLAQDGMPMANVTVAGSVPLTRVLTDKCNAGTLADLSEETVGPYLKDQLSWRIAGTGGENVDPSTVPGFQVGVYGSTSTQPDSSTELPEYSDFVAVTEGTEGKTGGLEADGSVNTDGTSGADVAPDGSSSAPPSASSPDNIVTITTTVCHSPTVKPTCSA